MRNFVRAQPCLSSRAIINAKERGKGGEGEVKEDKDSKRADEQRRFCRLFIEVTGILGGELTARVRETCALISINLGEDKRDNR